MITNLKNEIKVIYQKIAEQEAHIKKRRVNSATRYKIEQITKGATNE